MDPGFGQGINLTKAQIPILGHRDGPCSLCPVFLGHQECVLHTRTHTRTRTHTPPGLMSRARAPFHLKIHFHKTIDENQLKLLEVLSSRCLDPLRELPRSVPPCFWRPRECRERDNGWSVRLQLARTASTDSGQRRASLWEINTERGPHIRCVRSHLESTEQTRVTAVCASEQRFVLCVGSACASAPGFLASSVRAELE